MGLGGAVDATVWRNGMNAELEQWLAEVRADGLVLADEVFAGAQENLWCISWPSTKRIESGELVAFLLAAASIRRELAAAQSVSPTTFYAWHDVQAGQLRFSTARCTSEHLPFGAPVVLAEDPSDIIRDFSSSPYRDGIPSAEFEPSQGSGEPVEETSSEAGVVRVWAQRLT